MQNNHKAFSVNSWNVSREQGASWDTGAVFGVIRNFVYLVILGPGIVFPTWKETEKISEKRSLTLIAMPLELERTPMKIF